MTEEREPKAWPMSFSGPMALANLAGTKTMTRRLPTMANTAGIKRACWPHLDWEGKVGTLRPSCSNTSGEGAFWWVYCCRCAKMHVATCRYRPGDTIWQREQWARPEDDGHVFYHASHAGVFNITAWRPSHLMRKEYSRFRPTITTVKAEFLHDITAEDVIREGIWESYLDPETHHAAFYELWDHLNGGKKGHGSDTNWPVWVIGYKGATNG